MITETSAVAFRQNLGDMLNQVHDRRDSIVIKKDNKPIAALVDAWLFARIRRLPSRFDALTWTRPCWILGKPWHLKHLAPRPSMATHDRHTQQR